MLDQSITNARGSVFDPIIRRPCRKGTSSLRRRSMWICSSLACLTTTVDAAAHASFQPRTAAFMPPISGPGASALQHAKPSSQWQSCPARTATTSKAPWSLAPLPLQPKNLHLAGKSDDALEMTTEVGEAAEGRWRFRGKAVLAAGLWAVTTLPWTIAQTAMAAVTGGSIRGSAIPDPQPRGGRDYSSSTSRYERPARPREELFRAERPRAATRLPSIRIHDVDTSRDFEIAGRELKKRDVLILGGVAAAAVGQNEVRKRVTGLGGEKSIYTVGFQVALYDVIGVMGSFQRLAQRAETTTSAGLASLASNVCLELLRSLDSVVAAKSFTGRHGAPMDAEKEMHELGIRERKKWAYETTTHQQQQQSPPRFDPRLQGRGGEGGLMVVTLMVVCRKSDKALSRPVNSIKSLETSLEKLASLLLERGGKNVLAVDVSWTPDDPADVLTREELRTKWPDLFDF